MHGLIAHEPLSQRDEYRLQEAVTSRQGLGRQARLIAVQHDGTGITGRARRATGCRSRPRSTRSCASHQPAPMKQKQIPHVPDDHCARGIPVGSKAQAEEAKNCHYRRDAAITGYSARLGGGKSPISTPLRVGDREHISGRWCSRKRAEP